MDLTEKLKRYTKAKPSSALSPPEDEPRESTAFDPAALGLEPITTEHGIVYRAEHRTPAGAIGEIPDCAALFRLNGLAAFDISSALFLDLETTSLSIAAGSLPFLTGIGYFDGDDFITEQIFLSSPADEPAALEYLLQFITRASGLITFNGATFDVPLVKNRYRVNRVWGYPVSIPHADLIVPARRIFKKAFDSVSLQSLERNLLGMERTDDIPGWLIPDVYFTLQRGGGAERVPAVLEHNRIDIVTMPRLLATFARLFDALSRGDFAVLEQDWLMSVARHLYRADTDLFLALADFLGDAVIADDSVFVRYSIALKRADDWDKAAHYWHQRGSVFSLTELAKYYEHIVKDIPGARSATEQALALARAGIYSPGNEPLKTPTRWIEALEYRLTRLTGKKEKMG